MAIGITLQLNLVNPYGDVDSFYGPYNSVEEAKLKIPTALLTINTLGRKIGVKESDGTIVDYTWQKISNNTLDFVSDFKTLNTKINNSSAGFGTQRAAVHTDTSGLRVNITEDPTVSPNPNTAKSFLFDFYNIKGDKGDKGDNGVSAGFGTISATVGTSTSNPTVNVTTSGESTAKNISFAFDGLKGSQGEKGDKGDTGEKGDKGDTGASIKIKPSAEDCTELYDGYINSNGHLFVLTILNPKTFSDVGEIRGPQGELGIQGYSIIVKTSEDACTSIGNCYIDKNTSSSSYGHLFQLNSINTSTTPSTKTYTDCGKIIGETGATGATGAIGPQGPQGLLGLQGEQGPGGAAAGFGTPTASIDENVGTPEVTITATGPDTAKIFDFAFKNLKGGTGNGISSITGPVTDPSNPKSKTYTINYTNGLTLTYVVTDGDDGKGITSISKIDTQILTDTYQILYTDSTTQDYTVTNGRSITSISSPVISGKTKTYTINYNDSTTSTFTVTDGSDGTSITVKASEELCEEIGDGYIDSDGHLQILTTLSPRTFTDAGTIRGPQGTAGADGRSIVSITGPSISDKNKTYTINYNKEPLTSTFTVIDGSDGVGISSIAKTGTSELIDTYTITFTNGNTTTFQVTNGADGNPGNEGRGISTVTVSTDPNNSKHKIYTITYTSGSPLTLTFDVYDGTDGTSSTINVGSTSTLAANLSALVNNSGTTTSAVFDFGIPRGTTYTPSVNADGLLSWTNDGDKTNPTSINIKGPLGYTPTIASSKTGKITTVTFSINGSVVDTLTIEDGEDGEDGNSITMLPSAAACTKIGDTYIDTTSGSTNYGHIFTANAVTGTTVTGWTDGGYIVGAQGASGRGITSITKLTSTGLNDNYRITFTDNLNPFDYLVANGRSITNISTSDTGQQKVYTITYNDGTTSLFTVTDGDDGGYYTPAVSSAGDLSWTSSSATMPSIQTVNIKGPLGDPGEDGTGVRILATLAACTEKGDSYIAKGASSTTNPGTEGYLYVLTHDTSTPTTSDFQEAGEIKGPQGESGDDGRGISDITATHISSENKTSCVVTYDKGAPSSYTFYIPDGETGRGISTITKSSSTSTNPIVDTYNINYTDGSTTSFDVTNGFSPSLSSSKSGNTTTVTMHNQSGDTTFDILDGTTPTLNASATVTALAEGTQPTVNVTSGNNPVFTFGIPKGDTGNLGISVIIKDNEALCTSVGNCYINTTTGHLMYLSSIDTTPYTWTDCGNIKGTAGTNGTSATVDSTHIGNVGSGVYSVTTPAEVTITSNGSNPAKFTFNFDHIIGPQGDPGDDGFTPTITSSKSGNTTTVTITNKTGSNTFTVSDGSTPTISASATATLLASSATPTVSVTSGNNPVFTFGIPKGVQGRDGSPLGVTRTEYIDASTASSLVGFTLHSPTTIDKLNAPQHIMIITPIEIDSIGSQSGYNIVLPEKIGDTILQLGLAWDCQNWPVYNGCTLENRHYVWVEEIRFDPTTRDSFLASDNQDNLVDISVKDVNQSILWHLGNYSSSSSSTNTGACAFYSKGRDYFISHLKGLSIEYVIFFDATTAIYTILDINVRAFLGDGI